MTLTLRQKTINITLTFIQYFGFGIFLYLSPWMAKGFTLQFIEFSGIALDFVKDNLIQYIVGSFVFGFIAALCFGFITFIFLKLFRNKRIVTDIK